MQTQFQGRRICLLGGSGFLGRHVAARLVARGHEVVVLTQARHRNRDLLVLPTLRLVEGDPLSDSDLASAIAGADAVVNFVGIVNEKGRHGSGFHRVHVQIVERALAACRAAGIGRFIQISALKAGANRPSHYLRTKGQGETRVRESGLDWTIMQPSVIFGPEDRFINRFARMLRVLPVLPLARAHARLAPVWVGDVAEAVLRALESREAVGQTYQLCGPRVYSLREIVRLAGTVAGHPRPILPLPPTLGRLQALFMQILPGKPFSVDNFLSLSVHSICESGAPGLHSLGITPTGLENGLSRYLRVPAD
jgi:NADH dehydrogenase